MVTTEAPKESRTKRGHDHEKPKNERTRSAQPGNNGEAEGSEAETRGSDHSKQITLTGLTRRQAKDLRETVADLKAQRKHQERGESYRSERHTSTKSNNREESSDRSIFSRLGSSRASSHTRHGGDHHRDETWRHYQERREEEKKEEERKRLEEEYLETKHENKKRNREERERPKKGTTTATRDDLLKTIDDLKKRVEGEVNTLEGSSPFTKKLEREKKQRHLKHPNIDAYSGEGDPEDHLNQFDQLSKFYEYTDLTSCRFFATSLKGNAQRWFNRIPPRTIDSWADFKKLFLVRFRANKPHEVHTVYLESVRQGDHEDLESYLKRFKQAVDKVEVVNETEALIHLRRGLNPFECEKYICELMNQKPDTLSKAYQLASRFITEGEAMRVLKQTRAPPAQTQHHFQQERITYQRTQEPAPRYPEQSARGNLTSTLEKTTMPVIDKTRLALPPPGPPSREDRRPEPTFTVFSMPREDILKEIRNKPFFSPPPPMWTTPEKRNSSEHCGYHETHGHSTESCKSLKYFLERLLRQGHINQYLPRQIVNQEYQGTNSSTAGTSSIDKGKNIINVVFGGSQTPPRAVEGEVYLIDSGPSTNNVVSFADNDFEGVNPDHNEALVVSIEIQNNIVKKVLVDNGSSVDVMFAHCWERMKLQGYELQACPQGAPLYGLGYNTIPVMGTVRVPVVFGTSPKSVVKEVKLYVVNTPSAYNMILGRPSQIALRAITSITHLKLKFPIPGGMGEIKGDTAAARACYGSNMALAQTDSKNWQTHKPHKRKVEQNQQSTETDRQVKKKEIQVLESAIPPDADGEDQRVNSLLKSCIQRDDTGVTAAATATEGIELIPGNKEKIINIGAGLDAVLKEGLTKLLRDYADVFAWTSEEMPGINESIAMHKLNVHPAAKPKIQKRRNFSPERQRAIDEEIDKMLDADLICEVTYPNWVANVVLVKKANGKWRVCVDYTDLNAACPKDPYPLPTIDQLIDATAGHLMLSFMDAFSGYNQIKLSPQDREKTSFITHRGVYCYKVMPFGLINAGATYQRMMNKVFADQLGRNMEVYVDDMIVKSMEKEVHLKDLQECFDKLRASNMKLNPSKCTFALGAGKFLGYLVSVRGIEANPEKIKAITDMKPPSNTKEIQRLTGCLAALRRFIPRLADRCLPFFATLKGAASTKTFRWSEECQKAFDDLKKFLASPPLLTTASPSEDLSVYLSASDNAVGAVLVKETDNGQQPIYYVSQILKEAETRYPPIQKTAFALVMTSRKLRHYFQGRDITVVTDQPLKKLLNKSDMSGRLINWAVELSQFAINFSPRKAIKAQALVDFITECSFSESKEEVLQEENTPVQEEEELRSKQWKLFVDGSSTKARSGAGVVLISPEGFQVLQAIKFSFNATNNQAEYEALIAGLKLAASLLAQELQIFSDSQVVVRQLSGEYDVNDPTLLRYNVISRSLLEAFLKYDIHQIDRADNSMADVLSKLADSEKDELDAAVYFELLTTPTSEGHQIMEIQSGDASWMTPVIDYLKENILPAEANAAAKIRRQAARYFLENNCLYKKSFDAPVLKCIDRDEADYCMREVHEGICGDHMGGKALAHKILRQGYFWPTMATDCKNFAKKCENCQKFANIPRQPPTMPSSILSPIPFAMWGIDIMGPFPKAKNEVQYVMVGIDYMTKWVEAKTLRNITQEDAIKFVKEHIVTRFGIPVILVSDNGTQFVGKKFTKYLSDLGIKHRKASVCHPQSNGQVEVTNRIIVRGLEKRLQGLKKKWPEELSSVLWSYRTTARSSTQETPFKLSYGTEALLPVEIGSPSHRLLQFDEESNTQGLHTNLDLVDEARESAVERMAKYKERTKEHFAKKTRIRTFGAGDLVLRATEASDPRNTGKLMPKWEGPYRVKDVLRPGSYKLERLDGSEVNNTWHGDKLRKFYS
ncbi:uncharacterized protein LOC108210538 [Daucus carota subsp. sativus]|uniref:uncharacterized protein LOC108210538 n=1 Tax=Daucus carota subsp. sativus TaxID=79200 RepID=UPI0007EF5C89|nr:PREDICTED: uncharacterized protein LOC108210538 [Daucus carota subsp. sativus]